MFKNNSKILFILLVTGLFGGILYINLPDNFPAGATNNGLISVSVFENIITKEIIYIQIPDSQYDDMGKREGIVYNPTKKDYKLLLSYQYLKDEYQQQFEIITSTSTIETATSTETITTSTEMIDNPQPDFLDDDSLMDIYEI